MKNPVTWFEIATVDLERAKAFYAAVFKTEFIPLDMGDDKMLMFPPPEDGKGAGGALVKSKENNPNTDGTIVYFSCADVATEAGRVEAAGGKLLFPKMSIGEFGFVSQFIDTEGNRIGLHSQV